MFGGLSGFSFIEIIQKAKGTVVTIAEINKTVFRFSYFTYKKIWILMILHNYLQSQQQKKYNLIRFPEN